MSNSENAANAVRLVPGRDCGSCTSCCRDLAIDDTELKKAPGLLCVHCVENKGCAIYQTRPKTCQLWFCGWRQMPDLDDSWRPDRSEILITAASARIPAGYSQPGLTFELVGSLERIDWPPLVQVLSVLIANSIPVFLSVRGEPGHVSGNTFLNDELSGVIALGDHEKIAHMLRGALQACVDIPKRKMEFE